MTAETEYVPVEPAGERPGLIERSHDRAAGFVGRFQQPQQVNVPRQVPRFLGNRQTIVYSWLGAMAILSWDEWHNNHILPRPSRLWSATWVYLFLILLGMVDSLVPIANALAIGYMITLAWQYYNGSGQFA